MRISFVYTSPVSDRWTAVDVLRGVAIFFMVLGNFLAYYNILPSWLWHANWNGFTLADLGVPIFLFTFGISYQLSFQRRIQQSNRLLTSLHFLKRHFVLFAFGFFGYFFALGKFQWEVLQLLGAVGILALGFIWLKPLIRIVVTLVFMVIYQITILHWSQNWVLRFAHTGLGGPYAVLSWNFVLISGSIVAHQLKLKPTRKPIGILAIGALIYLFVGLLLSLVIPFNKHLVSISYIIFSTGIAIVGILIFHIIIEIGHQRIIIFETLGRNPLVCYITSQLVSIVIYKLLPHINNPYLLLILSSIILMICFGLTQFLETKKIYLRL